MPALRSIVGDKSREQHNSEQKITKCKEDIKALRSRQDQAATKETEEKEEEKERHLARMAEIED